jgi:NifU-like protein involved in Fe-S cluster formation
MDGDRVAMLALEVQACAFGQASSTIVAQGAAGRDRRQIAEAVEAWSAWLTEEGAMPSDWPKVEALAPARSRKSRHAAILLPLRALLAAMDRAR